MSELLRQSDWEVLSAWLDGELSADAAAEVERQIQQDPAWRQAADDLRSLHGALDSYTVPAGKPGLAQRILAGIPARELTESEIEDLSAYMDGECPDERNAAIAGSLQTDPAWRETHRDFEEVSRLLDCYTAPQASAELTGRIMSKVQKYERRHRAVRAASWLAPAAAAILLVGLAIFTGGWLDRPETSVVDGGHKTGTVIVEPELAQSAAFKTVPAEQRPALQEEIIRNLTFFNDYEVVADFETLQAIEKLDSEDRGI